MLARTRFPRGTTNCFIAVLTVVCTYGVSGCTGLAGAANQGANNSLIIATAALKNDVVGSAYSATLQANGGTTPYSWSVTAGSLPTGLSLTASTGAISGMPSASGSFPFTVQVKDSSSPAQTATANLSISIGTSAAPLAITTSSLPSGTQGAAYSATLAASGGTSPYTWSETGALPAGVSLSASGVFSGTPTASGTFSFTVQVKDSSSPAQTATANLSISIGTTAAPLAISTSSLPSGTQGAAYSATLAASGGTSPYTWSETGALPAGVSLSASGVFSGTPTASGTFSFTVQVKDSSSQTATTKLSISIGTTTAPLAISTSSLPSGTQGAAYSATLAASGGTSPYTWSETGALPAGVSLSASGVFSGTPTASGTFSITVQVKDSSTPA
ncbi:MAG TPA: putative Ig domain-containing protein, partial [Candidatus Cybelea sp.]|nr:putative Ig domain-containing protein [Candidatus Cybelea sp.]